MRRRVAALVLGLALVATACSRVSAQQEPPTCPDSDSATDPITVRAGERFVVGLQANQTTGYTWQADPTSLGSILRPVSTEYVQAPASQQASGPPLAGAGGKECLTFEAAGSGTTTLVLEYRRPFEPATVPPAKTKQLTVNVTAGSAPAQVPAR